jgi:hypothetical protein
MLPNTETNNKKYPLFMQSPFNMLGINQACHDTAVIYSHKITYPLAQVYEEYLKGEVK